MAIALAFGQFDLAGLAAPETRDLDPQDTEAPLIDSLSLLIFTTSSYGTYTKKASSLSQYFCHHSCY